MKSQQDALDLLEKIKNYTEFETVTVSPDGSVSVKYAGKQPAQTKKKEPPVRETAIDSLSKVPPAFNYEKA